MVNARCSHFNWRVWALRTSPKHMVAYLSHKSHYKSPCIPVIFPLWSVSYPSYEFHYIVWTIPIMVRFKPWILALSDRSAIKTWQGKKSWRIYMWCWNLNSWTFMCISKHVYTYVYIYICIHTYMFASVYIYIVCIYYNLYIHDWKWCTCRNCNHSPFTTIVFLVQRPLLRSTPPFWSFYQSNMAGKSTINGKRSPNCN
jgi:hypothetical protein